MFEELMQNRKELMQRIKYKKELGWKEYDEEGDKSEAVIYVSDMVFGYGVIRQGHTNTLLYHSWNLDETVEYAVDEARRQISDHELKQAQRPLPIEDKQQKKD